jgi:hypothetical protein
MTNQRPGLRFPVRTLILGGIAILALAACGAKSSGASALAASSAPPSASTVASPGASTRPSSGSPSASAEPSSPAASEDPNAGKAVGDVPDNANYLPYKDAAHGFTIKYVEGWQVVPSSDGVTMHDKDSSETVAIVAPQTDIAAWVKSTDLPGLQAQAGFKLIKQDTVKVGSATLTHLSYHLPAPPNPVTGKQVASTVDRYYVPGSTGLAVVSLSTPDGVDNVDAFRLLIESFTWN